MLTPMLALVLAAAPAAAAPDPVADDLLAKGRYRLAAQRYRAGLREEPDDPVLALGLGRALAGLGWCGRAVPWLQQARESQAWDLMGAISLGSCLGDSWRRAEAVEVLDEAVELSDGGSGVLVRLGWEALLGGDLPVFEDVLTRLEAEEPASTGTLLLLGLQAWHLGDFLEMERQLDALRELQPRSPQADMLEGWSWLELGEPGLAALTLRGGRALQRRRLPEIAAWMMEAQRRRGDLVSVRRVLDRQAKAFEGTPSRQALALRAQADVLGPQTVAAQADALADAYPLEPEALATAWYVAERQGRADRAATLAEQYTLLVPAGRHPLSVLIPLPYAGPDDLSEGDDGRDDLPPEQP